MPKGMPAASFYDFITLTMGEDAAHAWLQWFTTTYPGWAREGWKRIDAARAACVAR